MNGSLVFVDTGVMLHAADDRDPARRDHARDWLRACWTRRCGRTSVQVLNEFYAHARRKFPTAISAGDARAQVRRYQQWHPWQIDQATVETAWAVESRHGFGYWDALIIASAQQQGCDYLVSEDLPHGRQIESVQVLNPFIIGPGVLDGDPPPPTPVARTESA
jgi:predicted nucleic acid-binding protein